MKRILTLMLLLQFNFAAAAEPNLINFELQNAKLSEVIQLFLKSVLKTQYILSAEIAKDDTPINISLKNKTNKEANEIFNHLLSSNNIAVEYIGGVPSLSRQKQKKEMTANTPVIPPVINAPSISAAPIKTTVDEIQLDNLKLKETITDVTLYKPHHLSAQEIQKLLSFVGLSSEVSNDVVLYKTPIERAEIVDALLKKFDGYNNDVVIKATIFEFNKNNSQISAIQAALKIIQSTSSIALAVPTLGLTSPSLTLTLPNLTAVLNNISSNDDFRVLSEPTIRVSHNKKSSINVGSEVPVLSQITATQQGQPIQNVQYRQSGIILDVLPKIYTDTVELELSTQISNFVPTTNGVNNTPTLIQRKLETTIKMKVGETVLMGGLNQVRDDNSRSTFLGLPISKNKNAQQTDILLVLTLQKI
jgi:type II secretory pathway component GspD/PulD (secretin)